MARKILNLELRYKDKFLDTAKYLRDFKKSFSIGSDNHIFWQILDDNFPKAHKLITKSKRNSFILHLGKNMDIFLKRKGKTYTKKDLIQAKLMKNNEVAIDENAEGKITFLDKWQIDFSFKDQYIYVPTKEDKLLHKQFARWAPLTPEQKFTNIFLALALLFSLVGFYVFDKNYIPPQNVGFAQKLQQIEQEASKIIPEIPENTQEENKPDYTGGTRAASEEEAKAEVTKAQQKAGDFVKGNFGFDLGKGGKSSENTVLENEIYSVTTLDPMFVANGKGGGTKGGIGGVPSDDAVNSLFNVGGNGDLLAGNGSLAGDLGDIGNIGDISNLTNLGGGQGFEKVDESSLGSELKDFKVVQVKSVQEFEAIKHAKFGNVHSISEEDIKLIKSKEQKTEIANIQQQINMYKSQLVNLYEVESLKRDMSGTIKFSLLISKSGKIDAVKYNITNGSFFTPAFMENAKNIIKGWKIKVKEATQYEFRMGFMKR